MGAAYVDLRYRLEEQFGLGVCLAGPPWPDTFEDLWNEARRSRDAAIRARSNAPITNLDDEEIWEIIDQEIKKIARPVQFLLTKKMRLADVLSSF